MDKPIYRLALFGRLEPRAPWTGGRISDTDMLTLEEAARFARAHARDDVTPRDFLRAAARGEIRLHAIVHRSARTRPCAPGIEPMNDGEPVPAGAIPALPISACAHLAAVGRASWRTFERTKFDAGTPGVRWYFDAWELEPSEPSFETVPGDCRVTGYDVHALADAFLLDMRGRELSPEEQADALDAQDEARRTDSASRNRRGFYTLEEAASALAMQLGWNDEQRKTLLRQMKDGALDGTLKVRSPHTERSCQPTDVREFYEWVTPDDVNRWLELDGVTYRWLPAERLEQTNRSDVSGVAPIQRQAAQEAGILDALRRAGHEPTALPPPSPGRAGIKREVRRALGDRGIWAGKKVFDKAWERLASRGDISYAYSTSKRGSTPR